MKLSSVSKFFDRAVCTDVFNPSVSFRAQILPYTDDTSAGKSATRRVVSVDAAVSIPARRVISVGGMKLVLASFQADVWGDSTVVRQKGQGQIVGAAGAAKSIDEFFTTGGITDLYAAFSEPVYKRVADEFSPDIIVEMYCSSYETIDKGDILVFGSDYYLALTPGWVDPIGFNRVSALHLESPVATATWTTTGTTYNAATNSYNTTVTNNVSVLTVDALLAYEYLRDSKEQVMPGDRVVYLLTSAVPAITSKDVVAIAGVSYNVVQARAAGSLTKRVLVRPR